MFVLELILCNFKTAKKKEQKLLLLNIKLFQVL